MLKNSFPINYYNQIFHSSNFESTFLFLFISCKFSGIHAFNLKSKSILFKSTIYDIAIVFLALYVNLYSIHYHLNLKYECNVFKSLVIFWGTKICIFGGITINLLTIAKDFVQSNKLLMLVRKIEQFDSKIKHWFCNLNIKYNRPRQCTLHVIYLISAQILCSLLSIMVLNYLEEYVNMFRFYTSFGLITATFSCTTALYVFFLWAIYYRFLLVNQYMR